MKCLAIQQLEAIRQLKASGKQMLRNLHLTFVPGAQNSVKSIWENKQEYAPTGKIFRTSILFITLCSANFQVR